MKHPDSASFIYSMVKRARKYYLGVTTITQDVEDFIRTDFGKAIVTNASIQLLMKQSTAAIPVLAETFYLSEGERQLLVASDVGEGIFFAGSNHVALRVVASEQEHQLITTNPEEIAQRRKSAVGPVGPQTVAATAPFPMRAPATNQAQPSASAAPKTAPAQTNVGPAGYTIDNYTPPTS